jgi:hypothetical protein
MIGCVEPDVKRHTLLVVNDLLNYNTRAASLPKPRYWSFPMFEPSIQISELDTARDCFSQMKSNLEAIADFNSCVRTGQVTPQSAFPALYAATKDFYREVLPEVFCSYVPLYHSVWKHTLHSASGPDNLHQDAGVQYFARNGYNARMLNVWICLHKLVPASMPDDELGLYVVESAFCENSHLYEKLLAHNIHVSAKSQTTLIDNMQVAGMQVRYQRDELRLTTFPYRTGTMIIFSSHLLHGSKGCNAALSAAASHDNNYARVALSSVWLHKDDLNPAVLALPQDRYDTLYLSQHESSLWPDLKQHFQDYCRDENLRLANIRSLIGLHCADCVAS